MESGAEVNVIDKGFSLKLFMFSSSNSDPGGATTVSAIHIFLSLVFLCGLLCRTRNQNIHPGSLKLGHVNVWIKNKTYVATSGALWMLMPMAQLVVVGRACSAIIHTFVPSSANWTWLWKWIRRLLTITRSITSGGATEIKLFYSTFPFYMPRIFYLPQIEQADCCYGGGKQSKISSRDYFYPLFPYKCSCLQT